ncbi:class I SAM-dependent methyltransferase [Salarchaeum sp. JOR-1]|uniref:class I SAM-dependent methyltransferase n=1 Tax=Salarchaeum sp. JOR-1 TaxID=2599399 RepID=UPI0011989B62|nr:class I SAM-dependent methyltransferase [Salarchaeum sp. JOR-1]QDX41594.1 methyltransferase domain-containing protein [Salarchaeum sp. JOR-1]
MKKTLDEHAARFDDIAAAYDENKSEEYNECVRLVVEHATAGLTGDETVLDLATGTGAIALAVAGSAGRVVGRDISEGMMEEARAKAAERGVENVEFDEGRFRSPSYDGPVEVVASNFAMHHLADEEKREAIDVIAGLDPEKIVLGDVMLFGEPNPKEPFFSPDVDDPATVGVLADAFTDAGYALTAVEMVHDQVGVLVAERV